MKFYDVVIIGAGLAGLQCAKLLSRYGAKILLVDRKIDLTKGIHTTGIFVRKTLEDFDFPAGTLGRAVRDVTLYSPKLKSINLTSDKDEFRVGKMGKLYQSFYRIVWKTARSFRMERDTFRRKSTNKNPKPFSSSKETANLLKCEPKFWSARTARIPASPKI